MKKNGFVSMTLVVTFLVLFLFLMLAILLAYSQQNRYMDAINRSIDLTVDTPNKYEYCPYLVNEEFNYDYTGSSQKFLAGCTGKYKIELWGANGSGTKGGKRAYTVGNILLHQNDVLYVYVGEEGKNSASCDSVSFNSNIAGVCYSGGGATDIRLNEGDTWNNVNSLSSRIMVAAGGGGSSSTSYAAGNGGAFTGSNAASGGAKGGAKTANQTSLSITFGVAGSASGTGASSGGGGFFAGESSAIAGGGSSFISGRPGCVAVIREGSSYPREIKGTTTNESGATINQVCTDDTTEAECSIHYSDYYFTDTDMKTGSSVPNIIDPETHEVRSNYNGGFARITFLSSK